MPSPRSQPASATVSTRSATVTISKCFATGLTPKGGTAGGKAAPRKDVELDELKKQLATMQAQLAKLAKNG